MQGTRQEEQTLSGVVEHVVYQNGDTGYAVFRMRTSGERPVVVVGNIPYIGVGENVSVRGVWISHPSYGEQFKAASAERTMPTDEDSILSTCPRAACVDRTRDRQAHRQSVSGHGRLDVLASQPELLSEVQGITPKRQGDLRELYRQLGIRRLMEYLFRLELLRTCP